MKYTQKKNGNTCDFTFNKNSLAYAFKDKCTEFSFDVDYDDVPFDFIKIKEKNQWFRNAGVLWLIIGGFLSFPEEGFRLSFWFLIGVGCLVYYFVKQAQLVAFDTPKGRLLIVEDKNSADILSQISERRKNQIRDRYGALNFNNEPNVELDRFQWMQDKGIITQEEFIAIKGQISKALDGAEDDPLYE